MGELLISHVYALDHLEAIECLTPEVRASNFKAQNLYYKYGFRMVGRPRYYQDNQEDALLLTTPFMGEASQLAAQAPRNGRCPEAPALAPPQTPY
ncbi:MAG: hypothetical protein HEQ32_07080 [Vampirovibrio sp.]